MSAQVFSTVIGRLDLKVGGATYMRVI